jgi:hypothetical protein
MTFQLVKTALQNLLASNAGTDFYVVGAQTQGENADFIAERPMVQVFYSQTDWDESASPRSGKARGTVTFKVLLTIAKGSVVDIATLNDPTSTAPEIAAALAANAAAEDVADAAWDNLYSIVWNILRNPENRNFGVAETTWQISDNWIASTRKGDPIIRGEVVAISGTMNLTCKIVEYPGSTDETPGLAIDTVFNATIDKTAVPAAGIAATFGNAPASPKYDPARQGAKVGT